MLLNCLKCCKSISSLATKCPYCLAEVSGMVREVRPTEIEHLPKLSFFMKRSAYRLRKTAESLPLPSIAHVIKGMHG